MFRQIRREPAPLIFVNVLEDASPHELREMERAHKRKAFASVLSHLRESSAEVDNAVSSALDALESAIVQNPIDPYMLKLRKALERYQAQVKESADLVDGDDADDDEDTDVDGDDDGDADEPADLGESARPLLALRERQRPARRFKLDCLEGEKG